MFLTKRHGIYYLCYKDESGKRHIQSTKARLKSQDVESFDGFLEPPDDGSESVRHEGRWFQALRD